MKISSNVLTKGGFQRKKKLKIKDVPIDFLRSLLYKYTRFL